MLIPKIMGEMFVLLCIVFPVFHAFNSMRKFRRKARVARWLPQKKVSILVPCYNEQAILQTCISGMNMLDYANFEVIFINDGSSDETMSVLSELLDLAVSAREQTDRLNHRPITGFYQSRRLPHMFVIDKHNGGKADALNAGIEFAAGELVVTLDADSILAPDALMVVNTSFAGDVIAGGGLVRVLQGYTGNRVSHRLKMLVRLQTLEYLSGFLVLKQSLAHMNALVVISGAFGVFDRQVLVKLGGYRDTLGEDIDITIRFQRYVNRVGGKIVFMPHAVCYTECPENWRDLYKQRVRWQKAFIDCTIKYRQATLATVLTNAMSFFFIVDSFLVGTVATFSTVAYLTLDLLNMRHDKNELLLFIAASTLVNLFWNLIAIIKSHRMGAAYCAGDYLRLAVTILFDMTAYRIARIGFVIFGTVGYAFNRTNWNKVPRTGREYTLGA